MRPHRVLLAAAAALTALAVGLSATPVTAVARTGHPVRTSHRIVVGTLPVGPHARVDYLTGRLLHTAGGRTVRIDVPRRGQNSLELLGRSARGGWVVAYFQSSSVLAVSRSGRVRRITGFDEDYLGA